MNDNRTDAMVIATASKTPAEFAVVFDRHFDTIHRYLARRAAGGVADDLAGEVFRLAFEQRRRFRPVHDSALPWLYGIATNLLLKHWRESARELRAIGRVRLDADADTELSTDARLDAQPLAHKLVNALAQLPAGDRDVVVLIAWEELTYEEVAAALAIPVGTVRSRLSRARLAIRTSLDASDQLLPLRFATGKDAT